MELIKIGKALKTHGYKGHLRIFIDEFYMDDFEEMKAIFIDNLPYFIISKDINSDSQAIISLEEIDSKEKAQLLQGRDIFANEDDLSDILEDDPYSDIVGFSMEDKTSGNIGFIESIVEMPKQYLAKVLQEVKEGKSKEILIPLNEAYIIKTDKKKKIILVDLPEGFLDIF
ncbi:MAG: Ribosome maturation factor rimM [Bacteroidota bacterium]|nr:Ribosome maturation factor rimM [Bacteroidota bacterium]